MFLASTSRLYARETTKEEFVRYVRDNGITAFLQPALILLYKLPIKPNNLQEFFAEYVENGALNLAIISLLQAELCYLQSEHQDVQLRLSKLDKAIETLEEILKINDSKGIKDEEDISAPQKHDVKSKLVETHEDIPIAEPDPHLNLETSDVHETESYNKEETELNSIPYCIPSRDSVASGIYKDMKEFDPWGIIFKIRKKDYINSAKKVVELKVDSAEKNKHEDVDDSLGDMYDSEDGDTLVDLFHAKILSDVILQDYPSKQKINTGSKLSNLMGWNVPLDASTLSKKIPILSLSNQYCGLDKNNGLLKADQSKREKIQKAVKNFYSEVNSDFVHSDLFEDVSLRLRRDENPNYSVKGIQTDSLEEFKEIDGEGWEWYSDDYKLNPPSQNPSTDNCNIQENNTMGKINDLTDGNGSQHVKSDDEYFKNLKTENENIINKTIKEASNENQAVKQIQGTGDIDDKDNSTNNDDSSLQNIAELQGLDSSVKPCNNQVQVLRKSVYSFASMKPYSQKYNGVKDKAPQKVGKSKQQSEGIINLANTTPSKILKSTKLVKYIHDIYDNEYITKLEHEFDFRIFD